MTLYSCPVPADVLPAPASPTLADDLREDLLATWSPDVAAGIDLPHYGAPSPATSFVAQRLAVPRPNGSLSEVRILHPAWHAALHAAVLPLRAPADWVLPDGVFGYRAGALAGRRYADDWRRFCQCVSEAAQAGGLIVVSDVKAFFASTRWPLVLESTSPLLDEFGIAALSSVAQALSSANVPCLPTGYSDARLLANLVLARAEAHLDVPFARWVDDYRLFVESPDEAAAALRALDAGLATVGLQRNTDKTEVMAAEQAVERHHETLASVYHPERDPHEVVSSRLRALLDDARNDPVGQRRQLRFVLPRLAEQHDDIAVPFALEGLTALPWEAPRLVAYLSAFVEDLDLARPVNAALLGAVNERDAWLVSRLAPIAARTGLAEHAARALEDTLDAFLGTPAWGLGLRLLALGGRSAAIRSALTSCNGDARAVIVAARDLGLRLPHRLYDDEPILAELLADDRAPALTVDSLL